MHILRRLYLIIIALACPLLLFALGVHKVFLWVTAEWGPQAWHNNYIETIDIWFPPQSVRSLWALAIVLPIAVLLGAWRDRRSARILRLKTDAGHPLRIRQKAVNRYLHDRLAVESFVRDSKVTTRSVGGALDVQVRIWISADEQVGNLQERVLQRIMKDAEEGFGVSKVLEPSILVEAVKPSKKKARTEEADEAEDDEEKPALGEPAATPDAIDWRSGDAGDERKDD